MDGAFTANWSIVTGFDLMEFSISAQTTGWVAIGFSANPRGHLNTGAVVAWVANGKTTIIDTTSLSQRTTPKPNTFLQTMVISGTEQDGRTTVRFRRPIKGTPGSQLIPLTSSMYLIWAYGDADGTLASSYPQHSTTTRGFAQVNFLATGQVVWGDTTTSASYLFGIVTEPGAAMTVIVAFCIVILAIVQDTHRFLKRCRESQRRRAFRGFAGIDGFAAAASKPSGGVAPAALATPPAAAIATPAAALPSGTFDSDAFRLQTESIADKAAGAELSARSVSDSDMGSSLADYPAESMELNVVPSGGFFRGSQPVPYRTGALPSPAGRTGPGLSDPPAVFDVFIHRHKSISSANKNAFLRLWRQRLFGTDITVSEVVVFGAYVMLNLILVAAWPRKMSSIDPATAIGYMAAANAFWTAVPGTRNSAISLLLWAPVDKTIRYHRWIGRFMILLGLIHGVWELALQTPDINQLIGVISGNRINLTGSVTMMFALIILLSSLESIRRHLFQLFFYTHFVFFLFYLHLWIHTAASRPYIIAAAVVYGLDRALRMIRANLIPFRATEVQTLPGNVVRIRFPKRRWAMYTAGQYVFVNFPAIAPLEWHPFSLSSGPKDDYCEIHVKALGNTTRALFKSIQGSLSIIAPLMRVEGPYGHLSSRYERYSDVILIGGGVGVTPLISIIKDIYQLDMSQAAKARFPKSALIKRVYLVWSVPTEFEWAWFAETLVKARVLAALSNYPRLTIAGHITKQKSTADPSLIVGRPDLETVFRFVESGMIAGNTVQYQQIAQNPFGDSVAVNSDQVQGRAAVYACGPRQMVAEAWDISRRRTRRKIRFDFHHEIFEF